MSPEEDRTRDAVDSEPKHYQLSYSGPTDRSEVAAYQTVRCSVSVSCCPVWHSVVSSRTVSHSQVSSRMFQTEQSHLHSDQVNLFSSSNCCSFLQITALRCSATQKDRFSFPPSSTCMFHCIKSSQSINSPWTSNGACTSLSLLPEKTVYTHKLFHDIIFIMFRTRALQNSLQWSQTNQKQKAKRKKNKTVVWK